MGIPTQFDNDLTQIDQLHSTIMIRLRTAHWSNPTSDSRENLRQSLNDYRAAVLKLAGIEKV